MCIHFMLIFGVNERDWVCSGMLTTARSVVRSSKELEHSYYSADSSFLSFFLVFFTRRTVIPREISKDRWHAPLVQKPPLRRWSFIYHRITQQQHYYLLVYVLLSPTVFFSVISPLPSRIFTCTTLSRCDERSLRNPSVLDKAFRRD